MKIIFVFKKIKSLFYYFFLFPVYKILFKSFGKKTRLLSPLAIEGYSNISIGKDVVIGYKNWLVAKPIGFSSQVKLSIADGCRIGNFNHIYASQEIVIEKNVLTADKVYITDNLHSYDNVNIPIRDQPIKQLKKVLIGEGSWLGENVCIIGASIGKGCVIGANCVVNKDIPDFCVVVGVPARIIKRFDFETNQWMKSDSKGNFKLIIDK